MPEPKEPTEEQQKLIDEAAGELPQEDKKPEGDKAKEEKEAIGDKKQADSDLSNLDEEVDKALAVDDGEAGNDDLKTPPDSDDDDDGDGDDGSKDKGVNRKPLFVPLSKHTKALEKRDQKIADLQRQIEEAQNQPMKNDDEVEQQLQEIADSMGVEKEVVEKLYGLSVKMTTNQFAAKLDQIQTQVKQFNDQKEDNLFNQEFDKDVLEMATAEHGEANVGKIKAVLHRLAFTPQYAKVPLHVIYNGIAAFRPKNKAQGSATAMSSRGSSNVKKASKIDFDSITEDQIADLPTEDFEALSKHLKAKGRG